MHARVVEAINKQVNSELSASYSYLAMSAFCERLKFTGAARWLRLQSQEEYMHAMKLFDFVLARDENVVGKMKIADSNTFYQMVIIGGGANGSHFFRNLLQDIATYRDSQKTSWAGARHSFPANVILADGDKVETKNLSNQLFDTEDVELFKVDALAERYGVHYEVDVLAVSEYVTSFEKLQSLFNMNRPTRKKVLPILIGLVDNNRTRMLLHEFFHSESIPELVYIDVGVEGVLLKEQLPKDPNAEEKIKSSGFSGQVVCGYKKDGQVLLPPVAEVYASILADEESVFPNQSCGDLILRILKDQLRIKWLLN